MFDIVGIPDYENFENIEEERNIVDKDENEIDELNNEWSTWSARINKEVDGTLHEVGDRDNAHYFPSLADRLLKDANTFPLWSNVCRDDFGYGRVPASSAAVEGEFNKLKNNLLKNSKLVRVDEFMKIHLDYLHGKLKIIDANEEDSTFPCDEVSIDECKNKEIEKVDIVPEDVQQTHSSSKLCPACANGDIPSGAHSCAICKIAVHALKECSATYGEEGYGQERICSSCASLESSQKILAARETENWRGLVSGKNKNRTARYLGCNKHQIQDGLIWSKSSKLPIIKNGNAMELQAIKIDNDNYSLTNTCAFDSLLQIVLVALSDYKQFEKKVFYLK